MHRQLAQAVEHQQPGGMAQPARFLLGRMPDSRNSGASRRAPSANRPANTALIHRASGQASASNATRYAPSSKAAAPVARSHPTAAARPAATPPIPWPARPPPRPRPSLPGPRVLQPGAQARQTKGCCPQQHGDQATRPVQRKLLQSLPDAGNRAVKTVARIAGWASRRRQGAALPWGGAGWWAASRSGLAPPPLRRHGMTMPPRSRSRPKAVRAQLWLVRTPSG